MTTQTNETAPSPAISEAAVGAGMNAVRVSYLGYEEAARPDHWAAMMNRPVARDIVHAVIEAALPHLVQAAPPTPDGPSTVYVVMQKRHTGITEIGAIYANEASAEGKVHDRKTKVYGTDPEPFVDAWVQPWHVHGATRPAPASPAPAARPRRSTACWTRSRRWGGCST